MMDCPRCKIPMTIGQAIDGFEDDEMCRRPSWQHSVDKDSLKLVHCFKCPKCGHSDSGKYK